MQSRESEDVAVKDGTHVHLDDDGRDKKVFGGSYLAYASCYLARNNAAVAKVPLLALLGTGSIALWGSGEGAFSVAAAGALGFLDAGFLLAYTLGSFVVPAVLDLDKKNPWEVVWTALTVTGISQIMMCGAWTLLSTGFELDHFLLALACCLLNGAAQSVLYPSCKSLMADTFGADGAVLGFWNTCYYFGGVASTLLAAAFCDSFGWKAAFLGPGLILLALGASGMTASFSGSRVNPLHVNRQRKLLRMQEQGTPAPVHVEEDEVAATGNRLMQLVWPAVPALRVVSAQYFAVKLVRYAFGLWLPLLLASSRGAEGASLLLEVGGAAALFDVGSMAGSLALGAGSKQLGPSYLPYLVFGSSGLLAVMLSLVPMMLGTAATGPGAAAYGLLLCLGLATGGAETLLGSISPIHYAQSTGKSTVASAVASVNGYGSLGTVAAALLLPILSEGGSPEGLPGAFAQLAPLCWASMASAAFQAFMASREPRPARDVFD